MDCRRSANFGTAVIGGIDQDQNRMNGQIGRLGRALPTRNEVARNRQQVRVPERMPYPS